MSHNFIIHSYDFMVKILIYDVLLRIMEYGKSSKGYLIMRFSNFKDYKNSNLKPMIVMVVIDYQIE